jgi:hypothetical protein
LYSLALCLALSLALALPCELASAQSAPQQGFRLDRYGAPPTAQDGFALVLPSTLGHLRSSVHTVTHYGLALLSVPGTTDRTLVQHRVTLDVAMAMGLFDVLEPYVRLPMVLAQRGDDAVYQLTRFEAPSGPALSDMAIGMGFSIPEFSGVTLGGRVEALLPTGSASALSSDRTVEPHGELLAQFQSGRITVAGMLGGIVRRSADYAQAHVGPELSWGALLRVRLDHALDATLEAVGTRMLEKRDGAGASDGLELFVGARRTSHFDAVDLAVGLAVAAGLSELVGEPAFRALLSVGVTRRGAKETTSVAEPAPDRDADQVPDERDNCPDEPEDLDGVEDQDGCIDPDDDGDGVPDTSDACPREPGPARNGCPTNDLDEDGVPDAEDLCPRDAEDIDGDRDADGCPDRDGDGDGITDDRDACPDIAGLPERQGCLAHVRLERDRLVLSQPITFDTEAVALRPENAPVLDDVAALLNARTQLRAVVTVVLARRPVPDGGKTTAQARLMMLLEALVARGVSRSRITPEFELRPPGTADAVEFSVRAEGPQPAAPP